MKRVITGAIALPLLILFVLKASYVLFASFVVVLTFLGLSEYYRMALPDRRAEGVAASLAGALIPAFLAAQDRIIEMVPFRTSSTLLAFALTIVFLAFALRVLFSFRDVRSAAAETALFATGFLYVPLLLTHLAWLRALPDGVGWIFLVLVIVMSGDTAAYYVGSNLGRHKLYPSVSPNKSVEGAIGGLLGSLAGTFVARLTFFPGLTVLDCIATALLLGVLGQVGDLFESLLKRSFGVKDSGTIVPGHGGILDRLDSILFAVPAAYYYALFVFMNR
ncbi:phosphatidate cytidylyltransferase [Geobacter sulfurreducens]|uniref:phosphatidate cytidylyltransferase n=1 Tax=Geobacter sulfurreducens TaxID=35554 RepID=UPI000E64AA4C|nr:phosphatidate cytidylyltransferase [Geobacter sulfurreducens]